MKKLNKFALLVNVALAMFIGVVAEASIGANAYAVGTGIFSMGTVPQLLVNFEMPKGSMFMALQTEVWIKDIQEQLYAENEFISKSMNDSIFINNKKVHIPQAGAVPNVEVDRSSYPATIGQRTDTDLEYSMRDYSVDPTLIVDIDEIQTSYAKRSSILMSQLDVLNEEIALRTMNAWGAPTANVINTSGALEAILPAGAIGTRKAVTLADLRNVAKAFDLQNVPKNGRYILMPADMYYQLLADNAVLNSQTMGQANLPSGVVKQLFGLNIMVRSATPIYDVSNAIKAVGAVSAITDNFSAIAWQQNFVSIAKGNIKVFADEDNPAYFGSLFSAQVLHGANKRRTDNKGLVTLVQEA